jgi:hypothetical protein
MRTGRRESDRARHRIERETEPDRQQSLERVGRREERVVNRSERVYKPNCK